MTDTTPNSIWVQQDLAPALYLVATPIGNLRDITFRALDILANADRILCEDTRVSSKLLTHYGIRGKKTVYNDHSDEKTRIKILDEIEAGASIAMISDAGMPLISDPGYKLVREAADRDLTVTSIPGANAPLTALQLSGLPSDSFAFIGFLPHKQGARKAILKKYKNFEGSLIAFDGPSRLASSLQDMLDIMGDREACVARELTKYYEQIRRGTLQKLAQIYHKEGAPKGEIVVVIAPPDNTQEATDEQVDELLKAALKEMRVKDAAAYVADQVARPKKEIYQRALEIKD